MIIEERRFKVYIEAITLPLRYAAASRGSLTRTASRGIILPLSIGRSSERS